MKLHDLVDFRKLKPCGKMTERTRLFTGYGCNIKCGFCFYRNKKHIDIKDKIYQQLHQGKRYGIKDWDISGGEPSILPYWFDLLKDMKETGFRNIACITNGYKFADPDFIEKSKIAGLNELLFSVHGSNEEIHDNMTGVNGSFGKLYVALINARYYDYKIRINIVVTKNNYKDLLRIAHFVMMFNPVAINFLPFRIENNADESNTVNYSVIAPYIKKTIDFINDRCKIAIRYVPFCLFRGYEKYVAGYLQREFDEYEWNEYTLRHFERARENRPIQLLNCDEDKWTLEIDALHHSIKHVAGHSLKCLKCKYLRVCDGIWKSYANIWGIDEFTPIEGIKTDQIIESEPEKLVEISAKPITVKAVPKQVIIDHKNFFDEEGMSLGTNTPFDEHVDLKLYYAAYVGDEIAGFGMLSVYKNREKVYSHGSLTLPKFRRMGINNVLLNYRYKELEKFNNPDMYVMVIAPDYISGGDYQKIKLMKRGFKEVPNERYLECKLKDIKYV